MKSGFDFFGSGSGWSKKVLSDLKMKSGLGKKKEWRLSLKSYHRLQKVKLDLLKRVILKSTPTFSHSTLLFLLKIKDFTFGSRQQKSLKTPTLLKTPSHLLLKLTNYRSHPLNQGTPLFKTTTTYPQNHKSGPLPIHFRPFLLFARFGQTVILIKIPSQKRYCLRTYTPFKKSHPQLPPINISPISSINIKPHPLPLPLLLYNLFK